MILYDEINNSKNVAARKQIKGFVDKYADGYVSAANEDTIQSLAHEIEKTGIKPMDAMHLSCAIFAECDCFITTDKRILKYQSDRIEVLNPLDLLEED